MAKEIILWADDEIDLLKPHIIFLEGKGYEVHTATNGIDALEQVEQTDYDIIFLDENMPGLSGLETLSRIKERRPLTPVVMITKSEAEDLMQQAIGSRIADYLIKPVNPHQILLSILKHLKARELVNVSATRSYTQEFSEIGMQINDARTTADWVEVYKKIVHHELELTVSGDAPPLEMLRMQKTEANAAFVKFVKRNYQQWVANTEPLDGKSKSGERPMMSIDIFKHSVFPALDNREKLFFVVVDNLRLDQWRAVSESLVDLFSINEEMYYSLLPTVTQYARNAIFSGLFPDKIAAMFPELWVDEESEEGKNLNEAPLIASHFERYRRKHTFSYNKINETAYAERLNARFKEFNAYDINVLVINFVDMLSHARTSSRMIRELASSDVAYRSLTVSWFKHSGIRELFVNMARHGYKVVLTTDHGSINVNNPIKVVSHKDINSNLRYKLGKQMTYNPKQVLEITDPHSFRLPVPHVATRYIIAGGNDFFVYPNNQNQYVSYYQNTFQHGGISMEEMLIPLITLTPK